MPLRLLIVEDDPAGLMALTDALRLRLQEATVEGVPSAEQALALIASVEYDCVVCDMVMPGLDGRGLLKAVRTIRPELSLVLMTARDFHLNEQALMEGAYAFLTKPLDLDLVVRTVGLAVAQTAKNRAERRPPR